MKKYELIASEEGVRRRNIEHEIKINQQALKRLVEYGIDEYTANKVISIIAKRLIDNVTINY